MEMNRRFNILTTATDWIKRILKNIFERMLTKMTPPSLDLVDNLTPLGLCQYKTLLPERRMNFKSFLEYIQTLWITNVLVQFVPFNNRRRERGNLKKTCFNLNRGTLLVFVILFVLTEVGLIGTLDILVYQNFKNATQFPAPSSFLKGFYTDLGKMWWSSRNRPTVLLILICSLDIPGKPA